MPPRKSPLSPFKAARRFAQSLRLARRDEWRAWAIENNDELRARRIPPNPEFAYRHSGWVSWSDWLGANLFQPKRFLSYQQWRAWLLQQPIRTKLEYNDWCKANAHERRRLRIPSSPALVDAQFGTWREELRHRGAQSKLQTKVPYSYVSFGVARENVRRLLKSASWRQAGYKNTAKGWQEFARENKSILQELRIPVSPDVVAQYRRDWRGWRDYLGTNTRPTPSRKR